MSDEMREIINETFLLKGTEFALLLGGSNKESIYCFPFVDGTEQREKYVYSIDSMARNGIISPTENSFVINEPYNEMINCIKDSRKTVVIRSGSESLPDYCLYSPGNNKLLVAAIPARKDSVALTVIESEKFCSLYMKDELLPEESGNTLEPEDEAYSEKALDFLDCLRKGDVISDIDFLLGVDVIDAAEDERRSILVMQMPRGVFMASYDEIGARTEKYSYDLFADRFCELTKGIELK